MSTHNITSNGRRRSCVEIASLINVPIGDEGGAKISSASRFISPTQFGGKLWMQLVANFEGVIGDVNEFSVFGACFQIDSVVVVFQN
jgi:hypothetical protein